MSGAQSLAALSDAARACRECQARLPLGPRPIFQVHRCARVLVASQAPGRIAHESGVPFLDASGRRLREWIGLDEREFYDPRNIAILPMGLCYPGRGSGGDLPPRPECAPLWREAFMASMREIRLTLVIGTHAQRWHLEREAGATIAERSRKWLDGGGDRVPLPHPSPRNNVWLARHPWFESEFVPKLREVVHRALAR